MQPQDRPQSQNPLAGNPAPGTSTPGASDVQGMPPAPPAPGTPGPGMPTGTFPKTRNPYTNWFSRVASYIIDHISWIVVGAVEGIWRHGGAGRTAVITILYIAAFLIWAYNRWYLGGKGQSWGKMVMGTRLLSLHSGQPIGALRAFLRDVLHFFDALIIYIGFLWPIWDGKRQTLFADKIVKSVVLPEHPRQT